MPEHVSLPAHTSSSSANFLESIAMGRGRGQRRQPSNPSYSDLDGRAPIQYIRPDADTEPIPMPADTNTLKSTVTSNARFNLAPYLLRLLLSLPLAKFINVIRRAIIPGTDSGPHAVLPREAYAYALNCHPELQVFTSTNQRAIKSCRRPDHPRFRKYKYIYALVRIRGRRSRGGSNSNT
ncbi:hypothetical protein B0H16DRAFT_1456824 [Mycena metata]|uniref:Uncharacterized protein n=1 Tax=Mycena metata TaxID=1033252 RepID=A0AAD7JC97_9AGAR|nr:hypothetical protein B0H16DRAFT_1456824 [Mycena metata]